MLPAALPVQYSAQAALSPVCVAPRITRTNPEMSLPSSRPLPSMSPRNVQPALIVAVCPAKFLGELHAITPPGASEWTPSVGSAPAPKVITSHGTYEIVSPLMAKNGTLLAGNTKSGVGAPGRAANAGVANSSDFKAVVGGRADPGIT